MKIAFLCPSISRTGGGIFEIERNLAQSLANLPDTIVEVFGPSDEHTQSDLPAWTTLHPKYFPFLGPPSFRYSPGLRNVFLAEDAEIAHLHALWMYNSILIRRWAQRWKRPYIITANGMLEPWAVRNSIWKKRMALVLYERKCLNDAACIQVNSRTELKSVRTFGLKNPICIIPNGIDLPEARNQESGVRNQNHGKKMLLYLGRIHPKKGLVNLLRAWRQSLNSQPATDDWFLAIAGWDQGGHEAELKTLCSELKVESSVQFLGPKFGDDKAALYRNCDAFILPSFSEGLPMVILEAWAYGKPVLMTPECNLPEGFAANAAIRVEPSVESIVQGLHELFRHPPSTIRHLGDNGRTLVAEKFTWPKIAAEMRSVYEWVLGGGVKPECVHIN